MKNLSLILNLVLLIAVGVLYYLHFSGQHAQPAAGSSTSRSLKIAYVNSDTISKYYDYVKVNRDKLESKGKKLDQDLKSRAQALQNEIDSYQRNVSSMTIGQARAVEEDLGKKRQNLQLYGESLNQEMLVEQDKMMKELYDKVTSYLRKYGQERGLEVVLKYDATSDLLYAGDSLDISKEVVKGLNETFKADQVAAKAKKDSTDNKKK